MSICTISVEQNLIHQFLPYLIKIIYKISARVVGGEGPNYGRVQTYSNYNWRQLCGTGFTQKEAMVICRELGYTDAINMCCHAFGQQPEALADQRAFKCAGCFFHDVHFRSQTCFGLNIYHKKVGLIVVPSTM